MIGKIFILTFKCVPKKKLMYYIATKSDEEKKQFLNYLPSEFRFFFLFVGENNDHAGENAYIATYNRKCILYELKSTSVLENMIDDFVRALQSVSARRSGAQKIPH